MNGRRFALLAALCLFVMFLGGNLVANVWLRGWRLDFTQDHLYSLSPGARQILRGLSEPVELKFYYSRDGASANPEVQAYGARVREMLLAFASASHGKVRVKEIDVKPYSEAEDEAQQAGIEPLTLVQGGDPFYFGLVGVNAIDDRVPIPSFDPSREPFLEYELARVIYTLENPKQTKIALLSSLPIDPGAASDPRAGAADQMLISSEMGRAMNVVKLAADFTSIPDDADELVIIHPPALTPAQSYAIDQFIMKKGRAFIALDPASMMASRWGGDPYAALTPAPTSSNLDPILPAWGVAMRPEVVLDLEGALPVNTQDANGRPTQAPQPLYFRVLPPDQIDQKDLMSAAMRRGLTFGMAGGLDISPRPGVSVTTLIKSSGRTMRIPAAEALNNPTPLELLQNWQPTAGRVENVAVRIHGRLPSAYPNGPPEGVTLPEGQQTLAQSQGDAEIVVVADSDFLNDAFYVDRNTGATQMDNGSFALNAIDVLAGSDALVSLRSRAPSLRPMTLLDNMSAEASRRIEQRRQTLENQYQAAQSELLDLQRRGHGSGFFTGQSSEMNSEEAARVADLQREISNTRTQLRSVVHDLRADIERVENLVKFVCMWLGPILVSGAGLFLFWRRQRRTLVRGGGQ